MQVKQRAYKTMDRRIVNWSELPPELLSTIGNHLDASIDVLRFRSVCNSWRSSISPCSSTDLPLPLKFPCPFASGEDAFLSENNIYGLDRSMRTRTTLQVQGQFLQKPVLLRLKRLNLANSLSALTDSSTILPFQRF